MENTKKETNEAVNEFLCNTCKLNQLCIFKKMLFDGVYNVGSSIKKESNGNVTVGVQLFITNCGHYQKAE